MYKVLAALLFALGVLFSPTSPVFAENTTDTVVSDDVITTSDKQYMIEKNKADEEAKRAKLMEAKETREVKRVEQAESMKEEKADRVTTRCDMVAGKIEQKIARYEGNKNSHGKHYANVENRLTALILKLEANDYDTTTLESNLTELKGMTDEYILLYADFIQSLGESKKLTCGESDGDYKTALQESRTKLQTAKAKRAEIKEFFQTEIKSELQSIKEEYGTRPNTN